MMRVLEHGLNVKMVSTEYITYPVDTTGELRKVEKLMKKYI